MNKEDDWQKFSDKIDHLMDKGSIALLIETLEQFLEQFPNYAGVWRILASELIDVSRYEKAEQAIKLAEKYGKPEHVMYIYYLKGSLYRQKGDFRTAEKWMRKAAEKDIGGDYHNLLGCLLARRGKFEEAKEAQYKAIKLGKGATDESHLNLGSIFRAEKKYKKALEHAKKALEICPDYPEAQRLKDDLEEVLASK